MIVISIWPVTISEELRRWNWINCILFWQRPQFQCCPLMRTCDVFRKLSLLWPLTTALFCSSHLTWPKYFGPYVMTSIFPRSSDLFFLWYDMYCGQVPTDTPAVMYLTTLLVSLLSRDHLKLIVNKENNDSVSANLIYSSQSTSRFCSWFLLQTEYLTATIVF